MPVSLAEHKIWTHWAAAGLPCKPSLTELRRLAESELGAQVDEARLSDWLISRGSLTPFQLQVLMLGGGNALRLEEFWLQARPSAELWQLSYIAKHQPSGREVWLDFFDPAWQRHGQQQLGQWGHFRRRAEVLANLTHPHLVTTVGLVETPEHSCVVSDASEGVSLTDKLPRKARMTWETAAQFALQLADALVTIHDQAIAVGGWCLADVWLVGKQRVVLRVPWVPGSVRRNSLIQSGERAIDYLPAHNPADSTLDNEQAADWYALGCFLQRVISGRLVEDGADRSTVANANSEAPRPRLPVDWNKYGVPESASRQISKLFSPQPSEQIQAGRALLRDWPQQLELPREKWLVNAPLPMAVELLRKHLNPSTALVALPFQQRVRPIDELELPLLNDMDDSRVGATSSADASSKPAGRMSSRRSHRSTSSWLAWSTSLGLLLVTLAIAVPWMQNRQLSQVSETVDTETATAKPADVTTENVTPFETAIEPKAPPVLAQQLVADDGQLPWESPTTGARQSFAWFPPGARMLLAARPHEALSQEEAGLFVQALGPGVAAWIDELRRVTGMELEDFSTLAIALYSQPDRHYKSCLVVRLIEPISVDRWRELTQSTLDTAGAVDTASQDEGAVAISGLQLWKRDTWSFLTIPPPGDNQRVFQFVAGPAELVQAALELGSVESLAGPLAQVAERCDSQRHLSILFLPPALFNDEGQALMSGVWQPVNRWLRTYVDDSIRGGQLSLHWQEGCYLELYLEHARDIKSDVLMARLQEQTRQMRDELTQQLAALPASPHWDRVRTQLFAMVGDFWRQLRFGVEQNQVLVNGWLPPMATHNLLAGAELSLYFAESSPSDATVNQPQTPQTLEELLQSTRDLKVTTNPDLNLLLQSIQTEVGEQYPSLPFEFQIELVGNDLVIEGITQNQRPGDFELRGAKLADILTEIMLRANPDKSATGPADPLCKLVWVVVADGQTGAKSIKITTRAAALQKNWELPEVFRTQN